MDSNKRIEEMARKYKEEMLRMYNQNGRKNADKPMAEKPAPPKKPSEMPERTAPRQSAPPNRTENEKPEGGSKFPSPEELLDEALGEAVPANTNFQGNYSSEAFSDTNDALVPRYSGEQNGAPDESGVGYIKAEVTTGSRAVPIENAVVLITKKDGGKNYLLKMLITDESGSTESAALPAPNVIYSETPESDEKPFADYYISAYAEGFYAENDMRVPVFSGVKSIQPILLIPKIENDSSFMLDQ